MGSTYILARLGGLCSVVSEVVGPILQGATFCLGVLNGVVFYGNGVVNKKEREC